VAALRAAAFFTRFRAAGTAFLFAGLDLRPAADFAFRGLGFRAGIVVDLPDWSLRATEVLLIYYSAASMQTAAPAGSSAHLQGGVPPRRRRGGGHCPEPAVSPFAGDPNSGIYLGFGSNLGDRLAYLERSLERLLDLGLAPLRCSPVYETEAVTPSPQPDFLNLVAEVRSSLPPGALLAALLEVEIALGRPRLRSAGSSPEPRTLDLDLLLHRDLVVASERLTVPHPRLCLRRFVLQPLADLAPEVVVPGTGRDVRTLLAACPDRSAVTPYLPAPAIPRRGNRVP